MSNSSITVQRELAKCPVCKRPSYSAGRIHPQCAMKKSQIVLSADAEHKELSQQG